MAGAGQAFGRWHSLGVSHPILEDGGAGAVEELGQFLEGHPIAWHARPRGASEFPQ